MELILKRTYCSTYTAGRLYINDELVCYTLEDKTRPVKIKKETCIPEGTYEIKLRTEGSHHARYSTKFPSIHKGMLHLQDVPNFQYILIHIGNDIQDTEGCILVGEGITDGRLYQSTIAYEKIYPTIATALECGEEVLITIEEGNG